MRQNYALLPPLHLLTSSHTVCPWSWSRNLLACTRLLSSEMTTCGVQAPPCTTSPNCQEQNIIQRKYLKDMPLMTYATDLAQYGGCSPDRLPVPLRQPVPDAPQYFKCKHKYG